MLDDANLKAAFSGDFQQYLAEPQNADWRKGYVEFVRHVRDADPERWMTTEFQRTLWEDPSVSTMRRGLVDVTNAFADAEIAQALLDLRTMDLPSDLDARGAALQKAYDDIIEKVRARHTTGGEPDWRAWFRGVVEAEIGPLLDEYWYDDPKQAGEQKAKLLQGF